ncbi:MAG: rod shape-determining protein MreC [Desulfobacterales bacterium]|nr:rod shape-determining protein MreC [Desulfobacterales bacterium]MCF8080295.1 rod shape-determining protein MreC [Desulfobacterales bacterium]
MFSKKTVMIVGVILLIAVNIIILSVTSTRYPSFGPGRIAIALTAPFQTAVVGTARFFSDIWQRYFMLVGVARENEKLEHALRRSREENHRLEEVALSNQRLRQLLEFQQKTARRVVAAEVIGKDPSPWFKTIIIDKGLEDGLTKSLPVVVPEGVVGQVIELAGNYSKVLLVIDQNSAVDALVQRTRARGIVAGAIDSGFLFKYVLRKHDVQVGDAVVTSGLDGVFPKGLRVGEVSGVVKRTAGIFQEVTVMPYADFETLEEVLVILNPPTHPQTEVP